MPRKTSDRKRLVAKLDGVFSLYIRLRDKRKFNGRCAFDCGRPIEHCFHFVTRAKHAIRWDQRNAVGSCAGCNYRNEFDPHGFVQWYVKRIGQEAWDQLVFDGNQIAKFSNDELREKIEEFEALIKTICLIKGD